MLIGLELLSWTSRLGESNEPVAASTHYSLAARIMIATGLLDPFLAHLKTSQDQVAKGGFSIVLYPEDSDSATWFTIESASDFLSVRDFLSDSDNTNANQSQAFQNAWKALCAGKSESLVIHANEVYTLLPQVFQGPCVAKNPHIQIDGRLEAPKLVKDWGNKNSETWLSFDKVSGLTITGSGLLDTHGESWWSSVNLDSRPQALQFNRCDDCIAVKGGSSDINITRVDCGPGHGISIGSLGEKGVTETVENVHVQHCTFTGAENAARIKTWPGRAVKVSDVTFRYFRGTCAQPIAIKLDCDKIGCGNIVLEHIKITSSSPRTSLSAYCHFADVISRDVNINIKCGANLQAPSPSPELPSQYDQLHAQLPQPSAPHAQARPFFSFL
ncbi:hypothetical protein Bca101_053351 [Brassica carinata]